MRGWKIFPKSIWVKMAKLGWLELISEDTKSKFIWVIRLWMFMSTESGNSIRGVTKSDM